MAKSCQKHWHYSILWWFLGRGPKSFFWLLDVMQQLIWEILLDEAVKEGRNHKRGNTRMSGTPRLSAWGDRAAGDIKGKAGSRYWLPNNEPWRSRTGFWLDTSKLYNDIIFNATVYFSVKYTDTKKQPVMLTHLPYLYKQLQIITKANNESTALLIG